MRNRFITLEIARKNVSGRLFRSAVMILFVFVLSASLFTCTLLLHNLNRGLESTSERLGADIIVVPEEYFSSIENAIFSGKPCTVYFGKEWEDRLRQIAEVELVSSQLFLATLNSDCCESESQLIAFDESSDFVVSSWLETRSPLTANEAVIGCNIGLEKGDTVTYYGTEFTVAEILSESGMGYDNSVFINYDGAERLISSDSAKNFLAVQNDDFISMINLKVKDGYDIEEVSSSIEKQYDGITVFTSSRLLEKAEESVRGFTVYSRILSAVLLFLSTIAVMSVFSITINERKREFGVFLLFGTSKKQLAEIILLEGIYIILIGTAAGILLSWTVLQLFGNLISLNLQIPYLSVGSGELLSIILKCSAITFTSGIISVIYSAVKLFRTNGAELLEEGE